MLLSAKGRGENRVGIVQLVEYLTKKPGAILRQVQVPGAARDFSP